MTRILALLAVMGFLGSGCAYKYEFHTELRASTRTVSEWRHISMWGTNEGAPFDLEAACDQGVAEFGSYISFWNWLPAFLTIGVYTPRTVYAVCAEPEGSQ